MTPKAVFPPAEGRDSGLSRWLTPAGLAVVLLFAEAFSHALFHTLAEFIAVLVAMLAAVVGWQAYPFSRNRFLLYLAYGYFWIGGLDLAHALTYKGMGIFAGDTSNASIQLWLGTRYLEAAILLSAPAMMSRSVPPLIFWLFGGVALLLGTSITFAWFPTAFIPEQGLTPFKVVSEYVIIAMLGAALVHFWWRRQELDPKLMTLLVLSILFTAGAELSLTVYTAVGEWPTIAGHLLKLLSYWLIYVSMIGTTLTEPFRLLARGASSFDTVPDPTMVVDEQGYIRQTNRALRRLLGKSEAELLGQHCHDMLHGDSGATCPVCQAIAAGQPLEGWVEEVPPLGQWHEITLSPVSAGASMAGMVHVSRDITEQVRATRALRESEERFRGLVENTSDWLWAVDEHGRYTYTSPQVGDTLGYEPEELIGKTPFDLMPPEEAERIASAFAEIIARREPFKGLENVNRHKDGSLVVMETNGVPIFDERGGFRGFRGIDRDITERKRIERELHLHRHELQQLVAERTQALEATNRELESFSYSVSHDLRTPLRAVDGFGRLLQTRYADRLDATGLDYLDRILAATLRMGQLIDDLLQLSRLTRRTLRLEPIDLTNLARAAVASLTAAEPERALQVDVAEGLRATGDSSLVRVVLENLIGNALKFTRGKALAIVTIGTVEQDGVPAFYVRDNGAGFDMRYADKLFGAFQRLHRTDEFPGTGIGLATVARVIQRHGGKVWAEGEVGKGAAIYFTLPSAAATTHPPQSGQIAAEDSAAIATGGN